MADGWQLPTVTLGTLGLLGPIISGSLACWTWCMKTPHVFGVSPCGLPPLGKGGGLLHPVCPPPAGYLSRWGLYIPGCLPPMGPCVQCNLVGSGTCIWVARCPPWSVGGVPGSSPLMGSKSTVIIHPSIHLSIHPYINT